jgi:hypothetical protein
MPELTDEPELTVTPELTDELRHQHFTELGQRAGEFHRRRKAAVKRIVTETRRAQGLPESVHDIEVIERVAAFLEAEAAS